MNSDDGQVYSIVYCNFLVFLSTTVCSQNINKQNVNLADKTLTDYSFLSRYHYTKSKNQLKRHIKFVTEFPCLLGHPVYCANVTLHIHDNPQRNESSETTVRNLFSLVYSLQIAFKTELTKLKLNLKSSHLKSFRSSFN